jgi:sugar diacid utilization regulator
VCISTHNAYPISQALLIHVYKNKEKSLRKTRKDMAWHCNTLRLRLSRAPARGARALSLSRSVW